MFRPGGFGFLPPVVKNIIIINAIFYLALNVLHLYPLEKLALFYPGSPYFKPIQIVTHMFMHANFMHFFFNMFMLWMFGSMVENNLSPQRFFVYYILCGLGAAALHYGLIGFQVLGLKNQMADLSAASAEYQAVKSQLYRLYNIPVLGASGAVFGILLAFGMMFPNRMLLLLFPPIPIKAKYLVLGYGLLELFLGISGSGTNIAHFAHIGGMLVGIIIILIWKMQGTFYSEP